LSFFVDFRVQTDDRISEGGVQVDERFDVLRFRSAFRVQVLSLTRTTEPDLATYPLPFDAAHCVSFEDALEFRLCGLSPALANALRRTLIANVASMAIENVFVVDNSSVLPEEMLAHRLGLVPLLVDADLFDMPSIALPTFNEQSLTPLEPVVYQRERLVFSLKRQNDSQRDVLPVYSDDLIWQPLVGQQERGVSVKQIPRILIAKLAPGQRIELVAYANKGVGADHAKFSPVATAAYRLEPSIRFDRPVQGERAAALKKLCPMDVFDIEDVGGVATATVARPLQCSMCRECIREDDWHGYVSLGRVKDEFLFTVESTGAKTPQQLVAQALDELHRKCTVVLDALDKL
jgi:DNA-directed RNA polymerase I and III subunit RPAC1